MFTIERLFLHWNVCSIIRYELTGKWHPPQTIKQIELQHLEVNRTCIYQKMFFSITWAKLLEQSLKYGISFFQKAIDYFLKLNMVEIRQMLFCGFCKQLVRSNKHIELDIWLMRIFMGKYIELWRTFYINIFMLDHYLWSFSFTVCTFFLGTSDVWRTMNDDFEYIVFPSQKSCWPDIQNLLKELQVLSNQESCDLCELALIHQRIVDIFAFDDTEPREITFENTTFYGFVKFLQQDASEIERLHILQSTLPKIINLALEIEKYDEDVLQISAQQQGIIDWNAFGVEKKDKGRTSLYSFSVRRKCNIHMRIWGRGG